MMGRTVGENIQEIVYRRAIQILSHREHSVEELRRKLLRRRFPGEVVESVLSRLRSVDLVDDLRFAEMFVREKVRNKPMGRKGIALELRKRGVDGETATEAILKVMEDEGVDEEMLARDLFEKGRGSGRKRMYALMMRRGFREDVIRNIVEEGDTLQ